MEAESVDDNGNLSSTSANGGGAEAAVASTTMPGLQHHHRTLSRGGSIGKGSLGRYSIGTDISVGSTATRHWVNSVSDIYGPDEIEELLEDLNRLELAAFETEDIQVL